MRVLFDQSAPLPLRQYLHSHEIVTTAERGWQTLSDIKLLEAAEKGGLELMITSDKAFERGCRMLTFCSDTLAVRRGLEATKAMFAKQWQ